MAGRRRGHIRRDQHDLHSGGCRRGQGRQRAGVLHRRQGQRRDADQRGHCCGLPRPRRRGRHGGRCEGVRSPLVGDDDRGVGLPGLRILLHRHQAGRFALPGLLRGGRRGLHRDHDRGERLVDVHRPGQGAALRLRAGAGRGAVRLRRRVLQRLQLRQHLQLDGDGPEME